VSNVVLESSFGILLYKLCTCPRLPVAVGASPNNFFFKSVHSAHYLHFTLRVGICHHPALSKSSSCCPLHQEPGKSRMCLFCSIFLPAATLKGSVPFTRFVPANLCLELHYVRLPFSILRVCFKSLLHVSYLFGKACTHRVHVDRHLFANSPSARCSFPE